ncbi:ArgP/LysG family DNA-binding transcriptional regulator [Marinomonas sp. C2222]|uniref:ArgP/LysG family DNA-binding transcriptional regulator n=1 Tax=Marinomonas sargassi TaxID=2984494 RepID=A0ABT2YNJ9_9GAMM|nr:ArgP/LysG family DNA-binding transcriptional regulator [Marinomonas sargassi]MCV2401468.1 ArgP/LysG family DNA-binding transcriptional regulator [Marinomonas sargassi]
MLDYRALSSLHAVLRFQSFDKAASYLNLTQSAVSQNIKRLENACGRPLLIRARPITATPLGEKMLAHFNKVAMLEEGLRSELEVETDNQPISIAVNNDSLATWFIQVMGLFAQQPNSKLHIKAADQGKTRQLLQKGEVIACLSDIGTPVTGGDSIFLGYMHYEVVATPAFIKENIKHEDDLKDVLQSKALVFDENDELWSRYQNECLNIQADNRNNHWYPSSHGFVELVMGGTVCALVPSIQVQKQLESKALISLLPSKKLALPLYWHWYKLNSPVLDRLTEVIKTVTQNTLY